MSVWRKIGGVTLLLGLLGFAASIVVVRLACRGLLSLVTTSLSSDSNAIAANTGELGDFLWHSGLLGIGVVLFLGSCVCALGSIASLLVDFAHREGNVTTADSEPHARPSDLEEREHVASSHGMNLELEIARTQPTALLAEVVEQETRLHKVLFNFVTLKDGQAGDEVARAARLRLLFYAVTAAFASPGAVAAGTAGIAGLWALAVSIWGNTLVANQNRVIVEQNYYLRAQVLQPEIRELHSAEWFLAELREHLMSISADAILYNNLATPNEHGAEARASKQIAVRLDSAIHSAREAQQVLAKEGVSHRNWAAYLGKLKARLAGEGLRAGVDRHATEVLEELLNVGITNRAGPSTLDMELQAFKRRLSIMIGDRMGLLGNSPATVTLVPSSLPGEGQGKTGSTESGPAD